MNTPDAQTTDPVNNHPVESLMIAVVIIGHCNSSDITSDAHNEAVRRLLDLIATQPHCITLMQHMMSMDGPKEFCSYEDGSGAPFSHMKQILKNAGQP